MFYSETGLTLMVFGSCLGRWTDTPCYGVAKGSVQVLHTKCKLQKYRNIQYMTSAFIFRIADLKILKDLCVFAFGLSRKPVLGRGRFAGPGTVLLVIICEQARSTRLWRPHSYCIYPALACWCPWPHLYRFPRSHGTPPAALKPSEAPKRRGGDRRRETM